MSRITEVSQDGVDFIKGFEGFESKPYLCPAGYPTIGFGTILYPDGVRVRLSDKECTLEEAEKWLRFEISSKSKQVDAMTIDSINQNQFDALVSFAYNFGATALKNSTLLSLVNQNPNDRNIALEFKKWNKIRKNGKLVPSPGLTRRRKEETEMYFK
jgi:lysozyme